MFSKIYKINLELFTSCNRTCEWCPNSLYKREKKFLDKTVFIKLIQDLYNNNLGINFTPTFFIAGYSEPFLYPEILYDYIKIIRNIFNNRQIKIAINTNGDFLTNKILNTIPLTTEDEIGIMDYDCKGQTYWDNFLTENCLTDKSDNKILVSHHKNTGYLIKTKLNWPNNASLEDRGNSLDVDKLKKYHWANNHELRKQNCDMPLKYLQIYADGSVTFCCHFHPNNSQHKKYILGNLYNNSIVEIYKNPILKKYYEDLLTCNFEETCKYCQKGVNVSRFSNEKICEYYRNILFQYIKILSQYLPFKMLQIKNIGKNVVFDEWQNDKANPYLVKNDSKELLLKDIVSKGIYLPFILTPNYDVIEGKHKYIVLKENHYEDFYVPSLIIPNKWSKYVTLSPLEKSIILPNDIELLYPKRYKIPSIAHLKELNEYNENFYLLKTNNLYLIYYVYEILAVRLSHELYYYPEIEPIDYKEFLIKSY